MSDVTQGPLITFVHKNIRNIIKRTLNCKLLGDAVQITLQRMVLSNILFTHTLPKISKQIFLY